MPDNPKVETVPAPIDLPDLYWYEVEIAKEWTDGDTITVHFDFGMDEFRKKVKLRLARIDAFGKLSTGKYHPKRDQAVEFCNMMLAPGKKCFIRTVKDKTEKWGRYLAEVYIQADDMPGLMNFNDILVKQGLAIYWDGQGPHPTGEVTNK